MGPQDDNYPLKIYKCLNMACLYNLQMLKQTCIRLASASFSSYLANAEEKYPIPFEVLYQIQSQLIPKLKEEIDQLSEKNKDLEKTCEEQRERLFF